MFCPNSGKNLFISVKFPCFVKSTFSGRKRERSVAWEAWWIRRTRFSYFQRHNSASVSVLEELFGFFFSSSKLQSKFCKIYWGTAVVRNCWCGFCTTQDPTAVMGETLQQQHQKLHQESTNKASAFQLGWLQSQLKNTQQSWGHLGKMTEIPPSKKHNSTFSFVTPRQEQTGSSWLVTGSGPNFATGRAVCDLNRVLSK